jgi:glycosyltransferase involved in cell wall biosynthesis
MKSEEAQIKVPRLETPVRITEQVWPEGTVPVVSIYCITYQHGNFIREAIEGFLMQETTFPVEIIIHDDASTDGTAEILREYQEKFPQLFQAILQKENQYSSGNWSQVRQKLTAMCRGTFVATCEGDDYWISKEKLQKQVEFFDTKPDAVLCGCRSYVITEHRETPYDIVPNNSPCALEDLQPYDLIRCKWYLKTLSRMTKTSFFRDVFRRPSFPKFGDFAFVIACAIETQNRPQLVGCIDDAMCVYREHEGGVWTGIGRVKQLEADLEVLDFALTYSKEKRANDASEILSGRLYETIRELSWKKDASIPQKIRQGMEALSYNHTFLAKLDFLRFVSILIYQKIKNIFIKK